MRSTNSQIEKSSYFNVAMLAELDKNHTSHYIKSLSESVMLGDVSSAFAIWNRHLCSSPVAKKISLNETKKLRGSWIILSFF